LPHYARILDSKGYLYGKHHAPHDIQVRELGSGRSRIESAKSLGIKFEVVPNIPLEDGINAARLLFARCWFDEKKCALLLEALTQYRWDYNQKLGEFKSTPVHNWRSHAADAFRYLGAPVMRESRAFPEMSVSLLTGARVRLYGADNPDALRGTYFDGIIADEYADWQPRVWGEILRPALSDRQGWAVFIGTPRGHNAFYELHQQAQTNPEWFSLVLKASQTGLIPEQELEDARKSMTEDQYQQEFEVSFEAAIQGAIYAKELKAAREEGRITSVPYDPALRVDTWWDLGVGDATAIIFTQAHGRELRVIDYYEASGEGLPHYARILDSKGYLYEKHHAPHDIVVRELGSGRSRIESAKSLGIKFEVVPNVPLEDGINAARLLFARCWIDEKKCALLLEALTQYRWDYHQKLGEFKSTPVHDWSSHAADAFRYLSVGYKDALVKPKREPYYDPGYSDARFGWMA
jgi:phage terminase large subunit